MSLLMQAVTQWNLSFVHIPVFNILLIVVWCLICSDVFIRVFTKIVEHFGIAKAGLCNTSRVRPRVGPRAHVRGPLCVLANSSLTAFSSVFHGTTGG